MEIETQFITLEGYAVSPLGPPLVTVRVDGKTIFRDTTFLLSTEIQERYPEFPGADRAGFWVRLMTPTYGVGRHRLEVLATKPGCEPLPLLKRTFLTPPPLPLYLAAAILIVLLGVVPLCSSLIVRKFPSVESNHGGVVAIAAAYLLVAMLVVIASGRLRPTEIAIPQGIFSPLANWDGLQYMEIARDWYDPSGPSRNYNFFPLLPAILKVISLLPLDLAFSGSLVLSAAFLGSLALLRRLYPGHDNGLLILAFFPASFFFATIHTESLFLLIAAAFVWSVRNRRVRLAFLLGALGGLCRITGILLPLLLLDERAKSRRDAVVPMLGQPTGLAAWCAYLYWTTGDPFIFLHAQLAFARSVSLDLQLLALNLWNQLLHPGLLDAWELSSCLLVFTFAIILLRERRPGMALFTLAIALMPLFTNRLLSMNRYLLLCFPVFLRTGRLFRNPRLLYWLLAVEGVLGLVVAWRFGNHQFVG